jgi:hypothetical protein
MTAANSSSAVRGVNPRFRPVVGRSVPASLIRLVFAVLCVALCFAILGWQLVLAVALVLALAALVFPRSPSAWALAVLLAIYALGGIGAAPSWKFFVVLAGAHALHSFGMMLGWLPLGGPVQLRVVGRMLRTYVLIQVPAQLLSWVILTLLSGRSVVAAITSPVFGLLAAVGFLLLVTLVVVPLVRGRAEPAPTHPDED